MANVDKLIEKGSEAIGANNFDYAISIFKQIIQIDVNNAKARNGLYLACKKKAEEYNLPCKVNQFKNLSVNLKLLIPKLTKNWDKVIAICQDYLVDQFFDTKIRLELANALKAKEYLDAAIAEYEIIMDIDKSNLQAAQSLGAIYASRQDTRKAQIYFNLVLRIDPNNKEARDALRDLAALASITASKLTEAESTQALIKDKEAEEKLSREQKIVKTAEDYNLEINDILAEIDKNPQDPNNAKKWKKIGDIYYSGLKNFDKALEAYKKALELNKTDTTLMDKITDIQVKKLDDALINLENKLKTDPQNTQLKAKMDQIRNQKLTILLNDYKRRVKDRPTDYGLRFELGKILMEFKKYDEAISEFQQAIKDPRRKIEAQYRLALCFMHKQIYDIAITQFKKALELNPPEQDLVKSIMYDMACTYEKQGNKAKALEEFKKIIEIDYAYKDAASKVEALQKQIQVSST